MRFAVAAQRQKGFIFQRAQQHRLFVSANIIATEDGALIKAWTRGVPVEAEAEAQLKNVASLPFIHKWVAAMPDVHWGIGATVGSVIPTKGAIIPAAVGVDIGCGVMAVHTTLNARDLPDNLHAIRTAIEAAVPHGRTDQGRETDRGAWANPPAENLETWASLDERYKAIVHAHPKIAHKQRVNHLGTLGTGNHFIEVCLDEAEGVWLMLHSGSRGVGNRIGTYFIEIAREEMRRFFINLPDRDLAYLAEGTQHFNDYVEAVSWAQDYAMQNRSLMMNAAIEAVRAFGEVPEFNASVEVVNCHHNYVAREHHYGENVIITRKGAVRARKGDMGIIPGSMGARSYIVRGLGNPESFDSCSHGAGRAMSRREAKRRFTIEDHERATAGVECRKDAEVIDETPAAYKSIESVMAAQSDLVEIVHTLRQVICVKG
ncbi:MAG: RtcB family protein [Pyrinomonadaceae bacterium]|nr:RtcB family protein [Pyrinomonadaceae bacterium]